VSTKTRETRTFLSGWLDEGVSGRSLAIFRSCIASSGRSRMYTGCDWADKMGFPSEQWFCKGAESLRSQGI
jgi:hypothetical protein